MILDIVLVVLMCIVGFLPQYIEYKLNKFDLFNIKNAFILYYIIQLGFSGLLSLSSNYPSEIGLSPVYYHDYYTLALFFGLLGLVAFQLGYYKSILGRSLKIPTILNFNWNSFNIRIILCSYFVIGGISFMLFLQSNGGLTEFLNNIGSFRADGISGQGFLLFPSTHVLSIGVMVYTINRLKKTPCVKNVIISLVLLVISVIPAFFMGFRGMIVLPVLEYLVIFNYVYKKIPVVKMIPIASFLIIVFVGYGIIREIPPQLEVTTEMVLDVADKNPELVYAFLSRSKGTEVVASVIKKLEETGEYEYGYKSFFETITIFIPGALWKDKPLASSVKFTTYFFGDELAFARGFKRETWGGISPTIIGEAYWHFGWYGVTIGLFILGWLLGKIYETFNKNKENLFVLLIYAEVYPLFVMMAEAVQGYANSFLLYSITLVITFFALKVKLN